MTCQDLREDTILDSLNVHACFVGFDLEEDITNGDSVAYIA